MIGINTIVECNQYLKSNGLACKVHLKDGCNSQYMWIELFDEPISEQLTKAISDFFSSKGIQLTFSEDSKSFWETK
ncbi:hypothetical protein RBG61_00070 [Paludicola sp. MB14-C6]|uniref:RDAC family protein n=1 Tax=Paludihabitans sp. MB14-C6 TaxID=3070656 RepID=UPI0027DEA6F3|nr:hypothetical protein [Paludicola sp. MB14-C6]WMJ23091.1 hypothetical protein RBG61_00070 [Paludicola sp. MB14-C6]